MRAGALLFLLGFLRGVLKNVVRWRGAYVVNLWSVVWWKVVGKEHIFSAEKCARFLNFIFGCDPIWERGGWAWERKTNTGILRYAQDDDFKIIGMLLYSGTRRVRMTAKTENSSCGCIDAAVEGKQIPRLRCGMTTKNRRLQQQGQATGQQENGR